MAIRRRTRRDRDISGIMNPHIGEVSRNPGRDNTAGRREWRPSRGTQIQSGGPGGEFGGSQRLYTGRNPFMTPNDPGMDFGAATRGRGRSTGLRNLLENWTGRTMAKDLAPSFNFNDLLEKWHSEGEEFNPRPNLKGRFQEPMPIRFPQSGPAGAPVEGPWNKEYDTPYQGVFNDATTMAKDLVDPALAPELYEGFEPINTGYAEALANINNPEYANKWNMTNPRQPGLDEELMEDYVPPRPRWDNWLGNLVRSIGGRNRGGLASLKYAR